MPISITGGEKNSNKFGFDKVVFVCDINNIRNIFHAKYGANTDFTGYIDKFYSRKVFYYDYEQAFANIYTNFVSSITLEEDSEGYFQNYIFENGEPSLFYFLFLELVRCKSINIRKLKLVPGIAQKIDKNRLNVYAESSHYNWQLPPILVFKLVSEIVGGQHALELAFLKLKSSEKKFHHGNESRRAFRNIVGELILICDLAAHNCMPNNGRIYEYVFKSINRAIQYNLTAPKTRGGVYELSFPMEHEGLFTEAAIIDLAYEAFKVLQSKNVFEG